MRKEGLIPDYAQWKIDFNTLFYILLSMILLAFLVAGQHYIRYARQVEDFSLGLNLIYQLIVFGCITLMAPLVFILTDQFPIQKNSVGKSILIHTGWGLVLALIHGCLCNLLLFLVDLVPDLIFPRFWSKYMVTIFQFWLLAYAALVAMRTSQNTEERKDGDRIFNKKEDRFIFDKVTLPYEDILFFEAYDHYIKIHTRHKVYIIRASLKKVLSKLPSAAFHQVHRSFIVQLTKVRTFKADKTGGLCLELEGDRTVRVSRSFRKEVEEQLLISDK